MRFEEAILIALKWGQFGLTAIGVVMYLIDPSPLQVVQIVVNAGGGTYTAVSLRRVRQARTERAEATA